MQRKFCPPELRESVLVKIEAHRHAHPLIPGYSAPTPEGIRAVGLSVGELVPTIAMEIMGSVHHARNYNLEDDVVA
ncbi:hypothetical protein F5050DRAFT_1792542 [Lentinula boryana]|uniref:Uncharacterized protein n=1 Tax=Lentinula boryana TaxID=40481 RepID=A0ABQ8PZA8_9AGAR|nr:hypothetical protein F5050DRAFT_1792542 [Lentinula boryana]